MPPNTPDDTSTLERLRQRLYAPQAPEQFPAPALSKSTRPPIVEEQGWVPPAPTPVKKKRISLAALFLVAAGLFFLVAMSAAAYFLVFGSRSISTDRIAIAVDGPTAVGSGDTVTLLVSIENRNPVTALETMLAVEFPETTRSAENAEEPFVHYEDTVGDIPSGETGTRSLRAVLYGSENERIIVPIRFEYRVAGSNAVYVKEAEYEVVITSSPITVRAEAVSEISAGQPLTFAVTVRSHAEGPIERVAVLAQYPFGFTPTRGQGPVYPVGTLQPGEEKVISVTGTLSGEDADERVFRFTVGTRKDEEANLLTVSYATAVTPVVLAKAFLATTLSFNRDTTAQPVIAAEEQVQGIVSWVNTLATGILDGQVQVRLSGAALDTASINAYGGFYRSSDNTIIYSRESDTELSNLAPGATGSGSFSFRTKPVLALAGTKNPTVTATVSVSGRRVGEGNVPESVTSSVVRTIKVGTDLDLAAKTLYNAGPWPPVADQETTYTLSLALSNTVNSTADTVVTGTLPSYVRYVSASDGSVTYNAATRVVTWKAGEVTPGTGYGLAAKTASIRVVLLPSASQRGTSPVLMSALKVSGVDLFTKKELSSTHPELTTYAISDPAYVEGKAEVR